MRRSEAEAEAVAVLDAAVDGRVGQLLIPAVTLLLSAVGEGPHCQQLLVEFAAELEGTAGAVLEPAHCSVMAVSAPLKLAERCLDSAAW